MIRETAPFGQFRDRYSDGTRSSIIARARRFAGENGFEIAINEFGLEGFSILLTRADLNLTAVHSSFGDGPLEVGGIVRGVATGAQRELLASFRAFISSNTAEPR